MDISISLQRYDELIARAERLAIIENALEKMGDYESVKTLKDIFTNNDVFIVREKRE